MKKFIFVLILFIIHYILFIDICLCQWVKMSNGMETNSSVLALAVGENSIFAGTDYGVYLSTNNGTNWTQTVLNHVVYSFAVSGNNIFVGTDSDGVYLSTNNGTNWTQTSLNNHSVYSFAVNGNNIFAGTDYNGVFLSTNNGTNWTQTAFNNQSVPTLVILGNIVFAGTYYGVYLSTNNGTSWIQTVLNHSINSFAVSGNNIFAGSSPGVYLSSNSGTNWIPCGLNQIVQYLAISGNNIFAGTLNSSVFLSTNNGTNWIRKNEGFIGIPTIISLLITNNYIFAGTLEQSIWRRSLSEIIGIQNISTEIHENYILYQNYPNPFNPVTKIKFDVATKSVGQTFLSVYDLLGREVATLVNEQLQSGTYEVTFDGSNLPSGVYFYQLRAGEYTDTKKLVLLK